MLYIDKLIRHRACTLRDTAYAYIKAEMDTDFEDKCQNIRDTRKKRNRPVTTCPDFIKTASSRKSTSVPPTTSQVRI